MIDALNAKFANLQEPPSMYVAEYQELTSKLHELEIKEHELVERLQQNEIEPPEPEEEVHYFNNHLPIYLSYIIIIFFHMSRYHL